MGRSQSPMHVSRARAIGHQHKAEKIQTETRTPSIQGKGMPNLEGIAEYVMGETYCSPT